MKRVHSRVHYQGWRCGSSSRAPAYQEQKSDFNPSTTHTHTHTQSSLPELQIDLNFSLIKTSREF
jgi:hypothetical protein